MLILGISGSLRAGSHNTRLLKEAAKELPEGVEFRLFDGLADVPPYNEDDDRDPAPDGVTRLREALSAADAVLFSTPEYNFSVPGQLKNAIDWASRPSGYGVLKFTPVGVVGSSTGAFGAVWAQAELRKVLGACGARVVEGEVALGHAQEYFDEGKPLTDEHRDQLRELLTSLIAEVHQKPVAA
jgi:chromate reductase, NAD(P)H dehydrogenase (quinone)